MSWKNSRDQGCRLVPVMIPESAAQNSTLVTAPAWLASTASHDPREADHTRAVQSSLPVTMMSPTIRNDLHPPMYQHTISSS
jgi:hypothetical protein